VLAEYKEVLARPILHRYAADAEYIPDLLTTVALRVVPINVVTAATDTDDNCFLECAEAADADYLITGNKRHVPKTWKKTKIVNTTEFLEVIEKAG